MQVEEDNLLMRDMCLRLEAEVAKLRNVLATERGAGQSLGGLPPAAGGGAGDGSSAGGTSNVRGGDSGGGFLSEFAGGAGAARRGVVPGMSHMVRAAALSQRCTSSAWRLEGRASYELFHISRCGMCVSVAEVRIYAVECPQTPTTADI